MGIGLCTGRKCSYKSHRTQDIRHFLISSKTNPYSRADYVYPPASPSATYFKREHLHAGSAVSNIGTFKGPLKYLVAKLHGCYPGANSLPVSQNFFARFFRRRPVADSSRCLTFLLRCNKHKKHFLLTFFLLMFFFTVTTSEWCLYFLNLAVLLENFIHVRTY